MVSAVLEEPKLADDSDGTTPVVLTSGTTSGTAAESDAALEDVCPVAVNVTLDDRRLPDLEGAVVATEDPEETTLEVPTSGSAAMSDVAVNEVCPPVAVAVLEDPKVTDEPEDGTIDVALDDVCSVVVDVALEDPKVAVEPEETTLKPLTRGAEAVFDVALGDV